MEAWHLVARPGVQLATYGTSPISSGARVCRDVQILEISKYLIFQRIIVIN